jgi:glucosamine--fructose-6-phosphate aminotransferase (isomerizing)
MASMKHDVRSRMKSRHRQWQRALGALLGRQVYFGRNLSRVPRGSLVFFPYLPNRLSCGLTGIVSIKSKQKSGLRIDIPALKDQVRSLGQKTIDQSTREELTGKDHYLGGKALLTSLYDQVQQFKRTDAFLHVFTHRDALEDLLELAEKIQTVIASESVVLSRQIGHLSPGEVETITDFLEILKDIHWSLKIEIAGNVHKVEDLASYPAGMASPFFVKIFREINTVLNSIDRLEVRGRDSAGISVMLLLDAEDWRSLRGTIDDDGLLEAFSSRSSHNILSNGSIQIDPARESTQSEHVTIAFTYKIAAEIGSLGDNVSYLRHQIKTDSIFQRAVTFTPVNYTISSHTRWASVGAITESNCHPVDNVPEGNNLAARGIVHACLNGDIDNYLEIKAALLKSGAVIQDDISTDTKVIPLQIQKYLQEGAPVAEAFRRALNDFEGSHAISMHTSLAPGKLFLGQRGSGQAVFVGLSEDCYIPSSEVYGFVEETPDYLKLDGEKIVQGKHGDVQGQIFILDQNSSGGVDGIDAMAYNGSPLELGKADIKRTAITPRDIDRQDFPHYFLKEISEAPASIEKTLHNRWKLTGNEQYTTVLDNTVLNASIIEALRCDRIRRIYFVGQGTAGIAAQVCADILSYYLNDSKLFIDALKASELSGFKMSAHDKPDSMSDTLVIAISQSGTTTDTNRTVDMVRGRGARTLAIVNRRDSDITFKVEGVMYTSNGRDIEMSVASTKAFYSQIVAGAVLGLHMAAATGRRDIAFVTEEIKKLLELPAHMKKILGQAKVIESSARRLAATKTYWAAVGSGPNKASADEIRIKLSELCYKTISSDYVEDKKHIDLSSEPLILVCAAGARSTVIGDIIKDTAIFKAHKATPVVIADEGETRFDPYAEDIFHVPVTSEHLAPILSTLVGHLWGYYAALAINEGSRFLHTFREEIKETIDQKVAQGMDVYELVLEKSFRETIVKFYQEFREKKQKHRFPVSIAMASDLTLLLKYLSGKLPMPDFELDFGVKGTALNMINTFFTFISNSINTMSRPIDAIKHQAKTVTVGTSRISERIKGLLFDSLAEHGILISQITPNNVLVLRNLQEVVAGIGGSILYRINKLDLLSELTEETTIEVLEKKGVLSQIPSRVETDTTLKGTKRIIVQKGNVYIGKGRKDGRSILIIPVISTSSERPNIIENLLLLNISFHENVPLAIIIKALGGKYEHIKNIVMENSVPWEDTYLQHLEMDELFGKSAEKSGEKILADLADTKPLV